MKTIRNLSLLLGLTVFIISFSNCGDDDKTPDPVPLQKEIKTGILVNKSGGWSLKSVTVPSISATTEDQWADFKVTVSASTMNASGHPSGTNAVWPTGGWEMSENGNTITRNDQVVMTIRKLTATEFSISFTVPEGTNIGGRIASLDGDYIFEMQ